MLVGSRHFSEFCVYQSTPMPKRSVCAGAGGGGGAHPRPPGHQAQHARVLAPAESPGQAVGLLPGDTQILFSSVTGGQRRCDYSRAQQLELLSRAMSSWAESISKLI